jgi:hypothetical protein
MHLTDLASSLPKALSLPASVPKVGKTDKISCFNVGKAAKISYFKVG